MISGDDSTRILDEVMRGKLTSPDDNDEQREHREQLKKEVDEIKQKGGIVDRDNELP